MSCSICLHYSRQEQASESPKKRPSHLFPFPINRHSSPLHLMSITTSYRHNLLHSSLGAFPDRRRGSAARRGWDRILQFVTGDGERSLLLGSVPIGERGGLDLEGDG